jgi:hypothetical protein
MFFGPLADGLISALEFNLTRLHHTGKRARVRFEKEIEDEQ